MYTLALSISFSVAVSIFLKLAKRYRIDVAQAVAVNYLLAIGLCMWLLQPNLKAISTQSTSTWFILILLGLLLPSIFLVMSAAVRTAGIVLSDAAQRLSVVLPIVAAFIIFDEAISTTKALGILLALAALICLIVRPRKLAQAPEPGAINRPPASGKITLMVLLGVWLGYGIIDILFKQMARLGAVFSTSLLLSFVLAAIMIFAYLFISKTNWCRRSLCSGLLLGALNFSNIYFYIRAHQSMPESPTLVFAGMNMGVISLGAIIGAGFFKERLSWLNVLGIALALAAITMLMPR